MYKQNLNKLYKYNFNVYQQKPIIGSLVKPAGKNGANSDTGLQSHQNKTTINYSKCNKGPPDVLASCTVPYVDTNRELCYRWIINTQNRTAFLRLQLQKMSYM